MSAAPPSALGTETAPADVDRRALAREAFVVVDRAGRCMQASSAATALLGGSSTLPGPIAAAVATAIATGESRTIDRTPTPELAIRILPSDDGAVLLFEPRPSTSETADARVLDAVLETVPECIKVIAADRRIVVMNSAGLAMIEATDSGAILGRKADLLVSESDRATYHRVHEAVMRGETAAAELEIQTLTGQQRRIELRCAPLRDAEGRVVAALGVSRDITEQHLDAERLRESEARFRSLADSAPVGIALLDAKWETLYSNGRFGEILGLPPQPVDRARWQAAMDPDDLAMIQRESRPFHEGATDVVTYEYRVRHHDGTMRWVHSTVRRRRDRDGREIGYIGIVTDITAERRAQAELRSSEARFRQLAASAPIGIFLGDLDGRQIYANPRHAMIWQMSAEDAADYGWKRRIHPDDRAHVLAEADAARDGGREFTVEHRILLDDGTVRWVRGHVLPLRDENGTPIASIGTIEDITERREAAEAEARARANADLQRAQLEAVLEALPAGVIFADADGRVERATRQARLLWGGNVTAAGVHEYGRYRVRLRGSDTVMPDSERVMVRALRGEATGPMELEIDRLDGGTSTVLCAASPVRDAMGQIIGGVVVLTDVSERVRLELQLRQAQKMEAIGQLAGGIAHDFNNLLTVINGNLEFARSDLDRDHPVQRDLAEVERAAERARTLVRQLLAFSRKQVLQPRELDLNDVVRSADNLLRRVLGDEIAFGTTLASERTVVRADRGQLEQVLMNLAVNARDAMLTAAHGHPGKGGTLTIGTELVTLDAHDAAEWPPLGAGRYVLLTVSDTGHGMDATTRAHIFEPFFTTKAVGAGTGLGLAMVYGIVMQAGGALRVDSAPGVGATFSILLPQVVEETTVAPTDGAPALPRGEGTVLIVEDEAAVRLTTRRVLERQGYQVLEARHGADALRAWHDHRDAIIACVTDLRMPEMGGRELATLLRMDAPTLPVVFVSGYGDDSDTIRGPHDAFVGKPFSADTLIATLQGLTGARTL